MARRFRHGDRVKLTSRCNDDAGSLKGATGTVVGVNPEHEVDGERKVSVMLDDGSLVGAPAEGVSTSGKSFGWTRRLSDRLAAIFGRS